MALNLDKFELFVATMNELHDWGYFAERRPYIISVNIYGYLCELTRHFLTI